MLKFAHTFASGHHHEVEAFEEADEAHDSVGEWNTTNQSVLRLKLAHESIHLRRIQRLAAILDNISERDVFVCVWQPIQLDYVGDLGELIGANKDEKIVGFD